MRARVFNPLSRCRLRECVGGWGGGVVCGACEGGRTHGVLVLGAVLSDASWLQQQGGDGLQGDVRWWQCSAGVCAVGGD
jgi:hypothetical protein